MLSITRRGQHGQLANATNNPTNYAAADSWAQAHAPATHKIIKFNVPGAGKSAGQGTVGAGIVKDGSIVGWYIDSNSVYHPYLRASDGTLTKFDPPGSMDTLSYGMNSSLAIAGFYWDSSARYHGFLRTPGGKITNQIAGLLSLRELHPFRIYCTASLRRILQEDNSIFGMLNRVPQQVCWMDINLGESFPLLAKAGDESGIRCEVFSLGNKYPVYVSPERTATLKSEEALLGVMLTASSGGRPAYMPAVPAINERLLQLLETADLVLFDGTFWSDDELIQVQGNGATAREMGHVPVSGAEGSLRTLARLRCPRKVFVHVNNTNPMLDASSPEYRELRAAGWEVAEDGWHINL